MSGWFAGTVILGSIALGGPAAAATLDAFAGAWTGVAIDEKAHDELDRSDLDLTIAPDGRGFKLTWTAFELSPEEELRRKRFTARFEPTGRPGVYAFADDQGSLFGRLFASPASGNPLQGETLLWGRIADDEFVLYGLSLQSWGDFELRRAELMRSGDELKLERSIRTGDGRITVIEGRLKLAEN